MERRRSPALVVPALAMMCVLGAWSPGSDPQRGAAQATSDAYLRAVASHFRVPLAEVQVLADWNLPLEEVPVVLFLAERSGVSPDALIAIRRGGTSWMALAQRYGLDAATFHLTLEEGEAGELLGSVRERFRDSPPNRWGQIRLSDSEVVALVNVRFLSQELGIPAGRVVRARAASRDFVDALALIVRGG